MSEWRHDPLINRWVIIAPERGLRPGAHRPESGFGPLTDDPFAEGAEDETTPEVLAIRDPHSEPNGPGWQVRVIANKYPGIQPAGPTEITGDEWFRRAPGVGLHEVIIECPQSETHLSRLSVEQIRRILKTYRDRLSMLRREAQWAYALIFKNHGPAAGATLAHAHSQLMALPFVPDIVHKEIATARQHHVQTGHSFFAEWIAREQAAGVRIVQTTANHIAFCPFASRFPFEVCVLPQSPTPHFDTISDQNLADFARHLHQLLLRLEHAAGDPPFNFVLRTAPFLSNDAETFSWRLEILPRIGRVAGYEWGTGWFINPVPPERAAERLRHA